jgi:hypothetical protein
MNWNRDDLDDDHGRRDGNNRRRTQPGTSRRPVCFFRDKHDGGEDARNAKHRAKNKKRCRVQIENAKSILQRPLE